MEREGERVRERERDGEREGERGREGMPSEEKADNVKPHENDLVARWRLQRRKKSMVAIRFGSLP